MCFGDPSKSLAIARERMTAEQWARFEREFNDFCVVQGLPGPLTKLDQQFLWARWAFFQGLSQGRKSPRRASRTFLDAHYTGLALAMMSDEQAEQSLERWMGRGE